MDQHTHTNTDHQPQRCLHVVDVREGKDSVSIKAICVPAQPVLVGLLLLRLLFLFFPVQQLERQTVANVKLKRPTLKRAPPERDEVGVAEDGTEEGEQVLPHLSASFHVPPPDL